MDRYPVAGKVIGFDLWFGLSFRDLIEVMGVPIPLIFIPRFLGYIPGVEINTLITTAFGVVGVLLGICVLFVKDEEKRPIQYIFAVIRYHLTSSKYYKRRKRDTDLGDVQEVYITQMDNDDSD
jgi:hypothetical protein